MSPSRSRIELVLLHGHGDRAQPWIQRCQQMQDALARELAGDAGMSVRVGIGRCVLESDDLATIAPGDETRAWWDVVGPDTTPEAALSALFVQLAQPHGPDPADSPLPTILIGFSQGAALALSALALPALIEARPSPKGPSPKGPSPKGPSPEGPSPKAPAGPGSDRGMEGSGRRVVGVVSVSGFLPDDVSLGDGMPNDLPGDRRAGVPVLFVHGVDDEVVDVGYAEQAARQSRKAGFYTTTRFRAGGHEWTGETDQAIVAWIREYFSA